MTQNTPLSDDEIRAQLEPTVSSIKVADLDKRGISQCERHSFRKLNDQEVTCTTCPTVLIVGDADLFLETYGG